jgi:hypothetical protein
MRFKTIGEISRSLRFLCCAMLVTLAVGCSTTLLISDYDVDTDKQLTALQQSSDAFTSKLLAEIPKWEKSKRSPKNSYESQKKFYTEFDEKLRLIEFRVQSIPKNLKTQRLVSDIRDAVLLKEEDEKICEEQGLTAKEGEETRLTSLQALHCLKENKAEGPRRSALEISQRTVNQVIGAALALELAKKQGTESNK